ncbi:hypothetical protein [Rhizobium mesosinicum]|uniref:Uncharacterized protein n=1 Tax=Rhizobium mesosinicum TaxID=335017 RepID=A0ABS7GPQ1_9HYPH|nr:hypothetical protein [Rhizobium mesosinicum]MBW9051874.1 hypothetical protein [Rhizobium mesosinicum]
MPALIHPAAAPFVGPASLVRLVELRRSALEALIEELIALLDSIDLIQTLRTTPMQSPPLGSTAKCIGNDCIEDLELDDCDDEDGGDEEPTMSWSNPEGLRTQSKSMILIVMTAPSISMAPGARWHERSSAHCFSVTVGRKRNFSIWWARTQEAADVVAFSVSGVENFATPSPARVGVWVLL